MLFHNTIRKYTLALLSTFNNLKIEQKLSNGTYTTKNIPITYSSKEKSKILSDIDTQQLLEGNYNILPRANIFLSTTVRQEARITNKFVKINTTNFGEFMFNCMPYEFTYELTVQCRGMNEASMIVEQIASKFNPTYTIRINEVPNQSEPTSIPIQLLDISMQTEEYEDISSNIITISVGLMLKGNFYPPIRTLEKINNVDMFINMWHHSEEEEYNRAVLYNYDIIDNITNAGTKYDLINSAGEFSTILPVITNIISETSVDIGSTITLEVIYNDYDNKDTELIYIWNVTGSATITSGTRIVDLTGITTEIVEVSCQIVDIHGNSSNTYIKQIMVI